MKLNKITDLPNAIQELFQLACKVRLNAYSPYSHHLVGAALQTDQGLIFTGCNVENSSYGGTNCAERTAVFKAVSETPRTTDSLLKIKTIVVVTDSNPAWPPCGICRQVMAEFSQADTLIFAANLRGDTQEFTFAELLPLAFTPSHLKKSAPPLK